MPLKQLQKYLDENNVKYVKIQHSPAYTAPEIAESVHVSGNNFAKAVIVKIDSNLAMIVLPAHQHVDVEAVKSLLGANEVTIASEYEFVDKFPDCEVGAMPPFGNLFGMDVYIAPVLSEHEEIICNAGSHAEVIRLKYQDFFSLVKPTLLQAV